jgi:hypothetical protein
MLGHMEIKLVTIFYLDLTGNDALKLTCGTVLQV